MYLQLHLHVLSFDKLIYPFNFTWHYTCIILCYFQTKTKWIVYTGLTLKSMHRRQICEIEFAFYVHCFTVCFIERLIDHGILVCEQALYFLWWRVTWAIRDPSLTHATSAWFFTASFPAGNCIRAIATSNPVKKRPLIHFFFLYPFFFLLFFFFKKWNLIWKCINILPLALK